MQIKHPYLIQQIQKKTFPLYWLAGQDSYLLENSLNTIKNHYKNQCEYDEKRIAIQAPNEWQNVLEEANNYSLFSDFSLLNIVYEKKSLDSTGKKILGDYLKNPNPLCALILRTPTIPAKQLQWLNPLNEALFIVHYSLTAEEMNQWINTQLKKYTRSYDAKVPLLIQQYTQGNMLASAQVIEKISLLFSEPGHLSNEEALEQLFNQCEHNLFELADACLLGKTDLSVQILRQAAANKTESTLVLWMLTQEIRLLLQLHALIKKSIEFKQACSQLKIWPQRAGLYQKALKRIDHSTLKGLIHYSFSIDEQIKSNSSNQAWKSLELLAHSLCIGKEPLCNL